MSDDMFIDALLGIKPSRHYPLTSRPISRIDRNGRRRPAITGAAASGNLLAVATVEMVETTLRLRPAGTGIHELAGREQCDTLSFSHNLTRHLSSARVRHLVLRLAPETGDYSAKGAVYRFEAMLHLTPGLTVEAVHTQKIGAWRRRANIALPEPEVEGARYIGVQRRAIEAAVFGLLSE